MAKFTTNGLADFRVSLEEIAEIPDEIFQEMLDAEADIIEPAQKERARAYGIDDTGGVIRSIRRGKMKRTKDGRAVYIIPQGSRKRGNTATREAEIAFINEFGKKNQPPRPFIRDANESHAEEAVDAAAAAYDEWLKTKNL